MQCTSCQSADHFNGRQLNLIQKADAVFAEWYHIQIIHSIFINKLDGLVWRLFHCLAKSFYSWLFYWLRCLSEAYHCNMRQSYNLCNWHFNNSSRTKCRGSDDLSLHVQLYEIIRNIKKVGTRVIKGHKKKCFNKTVIFCRRIQLGSVCWWKIKFH